MKTVVFDFDSTLEEWLPFEEETENIISEELHKKFGIDPDQFKKIFDRIKVSYLHSHSTPQDYSRETWFREALAHFSITTDVEPLVAHYWDLMIDRVKLFPGTIPMLEELRGKVKIVMLTNSDGASFWKYKRIRKLGIEDYFDLIVTTDDVGVNKPHPRGYVFIMKTLGVQAEDCIMVGDSPISDLSMAKHLGWTTIWTREGLPLYTHDETYPYIDLVVDKIEEVVPIVLAKTKEVGYQVAQSTPSH